MGKMLKKPGASLRYVLLKLQIQFVAKENTQRNKAGSLRRYWTKWKKEGCGKEMKQNIEVYPKLLRKFVEKPKMSIIMKFAMRLNHWIKAHNPKMFQKVKHLRPRKLQSAEGVKNKDGKVLFDEKDILER